jgi:predicted aminopeptidase
MITQLKKNLILVLGLVYSMGCCACQSIGYYSQAVNGQYHILLNRQPIHAIIANDEAPLDLRTRLKFILRVREFAENDLQLPANQHYLTYVDIHQPYVAWNVFATPEFSLDARTWCYPIVGCAAYRGYFSEEKARQYAELLQEHGYDVFVGGVTAYSTLGWMDDPVLSTFLRLTEAGTAALIFHELAHLIVYVEDDSVFNESFATAVEQEGLRRWKHHLQGSQMDGDYFRDYQRHRQFIQLIMKYRHQLEALYQTDIPPTEKRAKKALIFAELRHEYEHIKARQFDIAVYDGWMNGPLNNARIISVLTYHDFVPAFHRMLEAHGGNLAQFYRACQELAQKKKSERHEILNRWMQTKETAALFSDESDFSPFFHSR